MASYHLSAKPVSRGKGQSLAATAAYNNAAQLSDWHDLTSKNYSHRTGVLYSGMIAPKGAPDWAKDLQQVVQKIDIAENATQRPDKAQTARKFDMALPHELIEMGADGKPNVTKARWLIEDFAKETWGRQGLIVNYAIHAPDPEGDDRNYHAHVIVPIRPLQGGAFAAVKPHFTKAEQHAQLQHERKKWANVCNHALERHGFADRVDHRTLEAQAKAGRPEAARPAQRRIPRMEYVKARRTTARTARGSSGGRTGSAGLTASAPKRGLPYVRPTETGARAARSNLFGVGNALAARPAPTTRPAARVAPIVQARPEAKPWEKFVGIARELDTWDLMWKERAEFAAVGMLEAWKLKYAHQLQQLQQMNT